MNKEKFIVQFICIWTVLLLITSFVATCHASTATGQFTINVQVIPKCNINGIIKIVKDKAECNELKKQSVQQLTKCVDNVCYVEY